MMRFEVLLSSGIQLLMSQRRWQQGQAMLLLLLVQPPQQKHLLHTFSGHVILLIHGSEFGVLNVYG